MIKFKEFKSNNGKLDEQINNWIRDNPKVFVIDIKYSANGFGSHALIMYKRSERVCNTHIQK